MGGYLDMPALGAFCYEDSLIIGDLKERLSKRNRRIAALARDALKRAEKAEAEVERLKCCGNCEELGGDYNDECMSGRHSEPQPYHAYRVPRNMRSSDPCHFTPSRWKEREG